MATQTKEIPVAMPRDEVPYTWEMRPLSDLLVDKAYQRPLSKFYKDIVKNFDIALLGAMSVSLRKGRKAKAAIFDGQTRWTALQLLEWTVGPCHVYRGLSQAGEADLFERLQTKRRGVVSYDRFRAALVAGNPESMSIRDIVEDAGYVVGYKNATRYTIASVAALEYCYRQDPYALERALIIFHSAWTEKEVPSGWHIRGMQMFLRDTENVNDEKLVTRLSIVSGMELTRKASMAKEVGGHGSQSAMYMKQAIKGIYAGRKKEAT